MSEELDRILTVLENHIADRLERFEVKLDAIENRLDDIEGTLDAVGPRLKTIEEAIDNIIDTIANQ